MKFSIPIELTELIQANDWPCTEADMVLQDTESFVARKIIREIFPGEDDMVFYTRPFSTALEFSKNSWCKIPQHTDLQEEVALESIIILGDFGQGSDSFFGLYFHSDIDEPSVLKQHWDFTDGVAKTWWKKEFSSFLEFGKALELIKEKK